MRSARRSPTPAWRGSRRCQPLKGDLRFQIAKFQISNSNQIYSIHNFKSQNFKLSVSNPKSKHVAYLSVLSQISNCQSLGRKNKHEILQTDRKSTFANSRSRTARESIGVREHKGSFRGHPPKGGWSGVLLTLVSCCPRSSRDLTP